VTRSSSSKHGGQQAAGTCSVNEPSTHNAETLYNNHSLAVNLASHMSRTGLFSVYKFLYFSFVRTQIWTREFTGGKEAMDDGKENENLSATKTISIKRFLRHTRMHAMFLEMLYQPQSQERTATVKMKLSYT
jgi:hypothetical protein